MTYLDLFLHANHTNWYGLPIKEKSSFQSIFEGGGVE